MINIGKRRSCCVAASVVVIWSIFLTGCASRDDRDSSTQARVSDALARAEQAMRAAGVFIDFESRGGVGALADLRSVLPEPAAIVQPEKQIKIEKAVEAFYETLDALEAPTPSASLVQPVDEAFGTSNTDLMMVHFHFAYLYTLAAVSRLARTGGDLYFIDFGGAEDEGVYRFELTAKGTALIESIDLKKDPLRVIKIFNEEQRQALIDALALLTGSEIVILSNPAAGIKSQEPQIDRTRFRSNASVHLQESIEIGVMLTQEIRDALEDFDNVISLQFSNEMLEDVKGFGFEIRTVPPRFGRTLPP